MASPAEQRSSNASLSQTSEAFRLPFGQATETMKQGKLLIVKELDYA
jgi:hypothetical protein